MAFNMGYTLIGQNGDRNVIFDFGASSGAADSGAWSAPTGDATWTKYIDNTTTAAETVMQDAGYINIKIDGTTYRLPLYTST
jgi:hypothetical protein